MNLVLDIGNTRMKAGTFSDGDFAERLVFNDVAELKAYLGRTKFVHALASSVKDDAVNVLSWVSAEGQKIALTASLPLPVSIKYKTPLTLGVDRIAAVCGAIDLFPGEDCLVIDAGTCMTFDFVDRNCVYYGGSISPGVHMRFESMHRLTAKLPLTAPILDAPLTGTTTVEALQSGVMNGMVEEIKGVVSRYKERHPATRVIMCGGDSPFFENIDKGSIFVAPDLVLRGLRRILKHHVDS